MAETAIHSYETIFIIDSTLEPEALEAKKAKFVDIITKNGEIGEVEDWGKRKLAYPINFNQTSNSRRSLTDDTELTRIFSEHSLFVKTKYNRKRWYYEQSYFDGSLNS